MFTGVRISRVRLTLIFTFVMALVVGALILVAPASRAKVTQQTRNTTNKKSRRPAYVPGEVLVRYRTEAAAVNKTREAVMTLEVPNQDIQIRVERFAVSDLLPGARLVRVAPERTLEAVAALREQPDVLYAEPNYILRSAVNPNDTRFASHQWNLTKIGAPQAYDIIRGSKNTADPPFFGTPQVVIGVVDQGIDINHQDLQANIWTNPVETITDGVDNDGNNCIDDIHGCNFTLTTPNGTVFSGQNAETHASHVAGIAGAVGNNSKGISGVNWAVGLMSLKFLDHLGSGTTEKAIEAVQYAKQMRDLWVANNGTKGANIRVLNASFGGGGFSQMFEDAINQANTSGILFVAAAGNIDIGTMIPDNDLVPHYPSSFSAPNIIAVAATNQTDLLASSFSHFGPTSVDLGAPGVSILSTTPRCTLMPPDPDICDPDFTDANGDSYSIFTGTSMSAPHISGAAAMLWAQNPNLTVQQVKSIILFSGDVVSNLIDKTLTGRRLNLNSSVLSVLENDNTAPGSVTNFHVNSQNGRTFNIGWNAAGDDGAGGGNAALYEISFTDSVPGSKPIVLKGVVPASPGTAQTTNVTIPFRHTSGRLTLREFDNRGNEGRAQTLYVSVPVLIGDPYTFSVGSPAALTTDTSERLNLNADDVYSDFLFPAGFTFPFFGANHLDVKISSNGALYFSDAPLRDNGDADDVPSSPKALGGFQMIAGLWDDLNLETAERPDAGVYVVRPSADRLIFRWQAKPCAFNGTICTGGDNVDFEIELNTNGTIKTRYGAADANLFPTVGIGGGSPDAYVVTSHTNEETETDLTNKGEVTFTPRTGSTATTVQFSQFGYNVSESTTGVNVTVTRSGNTTGTSTVAYATTDADNFTVNCRDLSSNAFARCDFATSVDTLTFGPGETSKTFQIPIINDSNAEGIETFGVTLNNATGAAIGTPGTSTITVTDNEAVDGVNPIFQSPFFVRQHYLDFLSREPEPDGFNAWVNLLNGCPDVNNLDPNSPSAQCDRIIVSQSFFGSQEFQLKGYFVYRFYKLAFNRLPLYTEIVVDMRAVTGATGAEVFAKRAAFTNSFVQRTEFMNLYNGQTNTQYVNTLMNRYSLTSITTPDPAAPDGTTKVTLTTADLINRLNAMTLTRAQVLRAIADSDQVFQLEFNRAFVAMQYFGYLRRDPETAGFNAWLNFLNANPTQSRTMINGFLNSIEYRLRFGP